MCGSGSVVLCAVVCVCVIAFDWLCMCVFVRVVVCVSVFVCVVL